MTRKLDFHRRREWEIEVGKKAHNELPTFQELMEFLTNKCQTLELVYKNKPKTKLVNLAAVEDKGNKCKYCQKTNHFIYKCEEFLKLSPDKKSESVKGANLCYNCLKSDHKVRFCKHSQCQLCKRYHNILLHVAERKEAGKENIKQEEPMIIAQSIHKRRNFVLLSTAQVCVKDVNGDKHICTALLDSGSQSNFITTALCKKLNFVKSINLSVRGISQLLSHLKRETVISIESLCDQFKAELNCLVLPTITGELPQTKIHIEDWKIPMDLFLADPQFDMPKPIDLLIGSQLFWELLCGEQMRFQTIYQCSKN